MLEIFIAALIYLGIIASEEQATQDLIDEHQAQIDEIVVEDVLEL